LDSPGSSCCSRVCVGPFVRVPEVGPHLVFIPGQFAFISRHSGATPRCSSLQRRLPGGDRKSPRDAPISPLSCKPRTPPVCYFIYLCAHSRNYISIQLKVYEYEEVECCFLDKQGNAECDRFLSHAQRTQRLMTLCVQFNLIAESDYCTSTYCSKVNLVLDGSRAKCSITIKSLFLLQNK